MMDRKINEIVRQVIEEVQGANGVPGETRIPQKGKAACLKAPENYEIEQYDLEDPKAREVLVKMEGCLVTPEDAREFLKGIQGYQCPDTARNGIGTVVKTGPSAVKDINGNILKAGDRVIALRSVNARRALYGTNRQTAGKERPMCGWYSDYVVLSEDMEILQVNDLDAESGMLYRQAAQAASSVERLRKLYKPGSDAGIAVIGCELWGLLEIAALKCCGFSNIIAVDKDEKRLNLAKKMGAKYAIAFDTKTGISGVIEKMKFYLNGKMPDISIQCVELSRGNHVVRRLVKEGGNIYDLTRNSSAYLTKDVYRQGEIFLRTARQKEIPLYQIITHRFYLEELNQANWMMLSERGVLCAVCNR